VAEGVAPQEKPTIGFSSHLAPLSSPGNSPTMIPTISLETRPRTGKRAWVSALLCCCSHCYCEELRDIERAFEILDADGAGILEDSLVGQSFIRSSLAASPPN